MIGEIEQNLKGDRATTYDSKAEDEELARQLKVNITLPNATEDCFKQLYNDVLEKDFDKKAARGVEEIKEKHIIPFLNAKSTHNVSVKPSNQLKRKTQDLPTMNTAER